MNRLSCVSFALVLACAVAACDDGPSAPTPTPPPTTAPTPTPTPTPMFSVSGTISETAPTASRRVEGVQVSLSNGPSATTGSDGTFTITGVANGTYTLTAAKAEYDTRTTSVTVASGNVSGVQISLPPSPGVVSKELMGDIGPEQAVCHGTSRSCDTFPFNPHHDGRVEVQLLWESDGTELDLEVRCSDEVVAEAYRKGGTMEELNEFVTGGRPCEVQVLHSGSQTNYRLFLKHQR